MEAASEIWLVPAREGMLRYTITQHKEHLTKQASFMIEELARHPGEIVSVDRMLEVVWPGKPPPDGKHRLSFIMVSIRKALPDGWIETVHERLYTWPITRGRLLGWRLAGKIHLSTKTEQ